MSSGERASPMIQVRASRGSGMIPVAPVGQVGPQWPRGSGRPQWPQWVQGPQWRRPVGFRGAPASGGSGSRAVCEPWVRSAEGRSLAATPPDHTPASKVTAPIRVARGSCGRGCLLARWVQPWATTSPRLPSSSLKRGGHSDRNGASAAGPSPTPASRRFAATGAWLSRIPTEAIWSLFASAQKKVQVRGQGGTSNVKLFENTHGRYIYILTFEVKTKSKKV